MHLFKFGIFCILLLPVLAFDVVPTICPHIDAKAGAILSTRIINPGTKPCQAQLRFANVDILPMTFNFDPFACVGFAIAEFTIPRTSPNGDAILSWECGGESIPSCIQLTISDGLGLPDTSEHIGTSGCVVDTSQTITELVTRTAANGITTGTITTIITIPVTSLASPTPPPTVPNQIAQSTDSLVEGTTTWRQGMGSGSVMVTSVGATPTGGYPTRGLGGFVV
ncbi:hypothetical protein NUW58_g8237 [Xylaria curta]|uniref:Uncharacterized protein n=1 Tax=Xylaria curta TaxID=42375 RepID=A0ACC1NA50_9PEZI|nr:hypothetical protein NUW58_g8237 [Xylaria curta]